MRANRLRLTHRVLLLGRLAAYALRLSVNIDKCGVLVNDAASQPYPFDLI